MLQLPSTSGISSFTLKALASHAGALTLLRRLPGTLCGRTFTSNSRHSSVYVSDVDGNPMSHTPLLIGLINYFERYMPYGKQSVGQMRVA